MFSEESNFIKFSVTQTTGFTLVEVIITVTLIGILFSFALPSYREYVIRGKLPDATSGLAEYRHQLEQYFQNNRNYGPVAGGNCGDTNGNGSVDSGELLLPVSDYFTFSCTVPNAVNAQSYTATAVSKAGQGLGAANNYSFTLDQNNVQQTTAFPGVSVGNLPLNCWINKKDSTC